MHTCLNLYSINQVSYHSNSFLDKDISLARRMKSVLLFRPGTNPDFQMCCSGQIHNLRMRLHQSNDHDYWRTPNGLRKPAGLNRRVDVGASSAKPNWSWCSRSWDPVAVVSISPRGLLGQDPEQTGTTWEMILRRRPNPSAF